MTRRVRSSNKGHTERNLAVSSARLSMLSQHNNHQHRMLPLFIYAAYVNQLKRQTGKDLLVYGGSSFVASLIERNLIDEYHLLLNPFLLGSGLTISRGLADTFRLTLVTNRAFSCGTVLLCYEAFRD